MKIQELSKFLACPICIKSLKIESEQRLLCDRCHHGFPVEEGIPVMIVESTQNETKAAQNTFYTIVAKSLEASGIASIAHYLNYGYSPNDNPQLAPIELPSFCLDKNSVKLTLEVVGNVDLRFKRVIEIGSGRGGNIRTINKYFDPEIMLGIDICEVSVRFSSSKTDQENIGFLIGDAERVPFRSGIFDIVLNIESSHAYPNIGQFYSEVRRLLRPEGYFLYSDILSKEKYAWCESYLEKLGFVIEHKRDITSNVLLSCDEIASKRKRHYGQDDFNDVADFLAVPGSPTYDAMASGEALYSILTLSNSRGN
jgi:ubiquinone/menaquinone biosynthesis C-methylase UbiE/uncharacterized protein YbaR (Trm112 family)